MYFRARTIDIPMTLERRLDRQQFRCDPNNAQLLEYDILKLTSLELGCNLPWSRIKLSMLQKHYQPHQFHMIFYTMKVTYLTAIPMRISKDMVKKGI